MGFDYHVHGLWILGSVTGLVGSMLAGNVEWVEGTTEASFGISLLLAFLLILITGMCWISAATNARQETN